MSFCRLFSRWFKVPFSSPSCRSLNPLKGSRFHHPKKVMGWMTRFRKYICCFNWARLKTLTWHSSKPWFLFVEILWDPYNWPQITRVNWSLLNWCFISSPIPFIHGLKKKRPSWNFILLVGVISLVGGWTNPCQKYKNVLVNLDHFPKFRDENKEYLKPPSCHPFITGKPPTTNRIRL